MKNIYHKYNSIIALLLGVCTILLLLTSIQLSASAQQRNPYGFYLTGDVETIERIEVRLSDTTQEVITDIEPPLDFYGEEDMLFGENIADDHGADTYHHLEHNHNEHDHNDHDDEHHDHTELLHETQLTQLYTFPPGITELNFFPAEAAVRIHWVYGDSPPNQAQKAAQGTVTAYKDIFYNALGLDVVLREEWGAPQESGWEPTIADEISTIVIHHTATRIDTNDPPQAVRAVYEFHRNRCANNVGSFDPDNPDCDEPEETWQDIGYNFIIDQNGTVYEGRAGMHASIGAHSPPNAGTIGIAVIGNYEAATPSESALRSLEGLIHTLGAFNRIDVRSEGVVVGHRDRQNTACPGRNIIAALDSLRGATFLPRKDIIDMREKARNMVHNRSISKTSNGQYTFVVDTDSLTVLSEAFIRARVPGAVMLENEDTHMMRLRVEQAAAERFLREILIFDSSIQIQPEYLYRRAAWSEDLSVNPPKSTPQEYEQITHWYLDTINMPNAWSALDCPEGDSCQGSETVVVAVIDGGIAYEDFTYDAGGDYELVQVNGLNLEIPQSDIPNGIVNEGLDRNYTVAPSLKNASFQTPGYDAVQDQICQFRDANNIPCNEYELEKIDHANDDEGHGTYVTSIIAASLQDNDGLVGIAPNISILPIKAFFPNDSSFCYAVNGENDPDCLLVNSQYHLRDITNSTLLAESIDFAVENNADIINMSVAGQLDPNSFTRDFVLTQSIQRAIDQGVIVVAAAGNNGGDVDTVFPASFDGVVTVGATNQDNEVAYYSNQGDSLDIVAPVGDIFGSGILGHQYSCTVDDTCYDETVPDQFTEYVIEEQIGTSFAAPQVSAVLALMMSVAPEKSSTELIQLLLQSTLDLGAEGFDTAHGYGLLDAYAAISSLDNSIKAEQVYRFFNTETGAHFYTTSVVERDSIMKNLPQFSYEGVKFSVFTQKNNLVVPVYRFYNNETQAHFYTVNEGERAFIRANLVHYTDEGVAFYVYETNIGNPVYRFLNTESGTHLYTDNEFERIAVLGEDHFNDEGVGFYVP